MPYKPASPRQLLQATVFQTLFQRIEIHAELLRRVKEALPGNMVKHCLSCLAREDGVLVVFSDSQVFASQMRFYAPSTLAKLNANQASQFKQLLVKNPGPMTDVPAERPLKKASQEVIDMIKANSLNASSEELGKALAKLGATMERFAKDQT